MDSTNEYFLLERIGGAMIREVLHSSHAGTAAWATYGHHDSPNWSRKFDLVEHATNFLLDELLIRRELGIPRLKVDHDLVVDGHRLDARQKRARCIRQP